MLEKYRLNLSRICNCIEKNYEIIQKIIEDVDTIFHEDPNGDNNCYHEIHKHLKSNNEPVSTLDTERVQITLKQIARDWSSACEDERDQCYQPIIDALLAQYSTETDLKDIRVLVPGAGLGRLTYEIALRGFYCEGNEFSYFMLLAANFILNRYTSIST